MRSVSEAVARLRSALATALVGGPDPSGSEHALDDLRKIEACPLWEGQEKLAAFATSVRDPSSFPGTSRPVVLARGQRYLLSLAMEIEDLSDEPAKRDKSTGRKRKDAAPNTPFDPALLDLSGVGPKTAARLASRGLSSPLDVLFWLPRRYDDRRTITPIGELKAGTRVMTSGIVDSIRVYGRPWRRIMEIKLKDGDDALSAMWFSNRRPRSDRFKKGDEIVLAGLVSNYKGRLQIAYPVVASADDESDRMGRVVPVYAEVPGVGGRVVEKAIGSAARRASELVSDPMPAQLLDRRGLVPLDRALQIVHLPPDDVSAKDLDAWIDGSSPAHRRLAYDEFFYIQLALSLRRKQMDRSPAWVIEKDDSLPTEAGKMLGFTPTAAQLKVSGEILADMSVNRPMRRLLQGDVGSGKTVVALAAIVAAVRSGCQAALMAPTEILAEQHMRTLGPVLEKQGIRVVLHIGQARSSVKKKSLRALETGAAGLAIGTHALIQGSVNFAKLGLAIVDEQHRFGVAQRLGLVGKGQDARSPHLLVMTATPIPRTLALTVHGDLDVSVLDELPPGRMPVETFLWSEDQREEALVKLSLALDRGEQAYLICPIIEESDKIEVNAATDVYEEMAARFGDERTGLLHGRLPPEERDRVMDDFANGRIDLLVATTVVEVGVDVPTATIMIIDGAHRFGLAQLHQLRGRVGRGLKASECHLVYDSRSVDSLARMEVIVRTTDGFEIAESDLQLRGPGELYGRRQAGLPGFRFGNLARDGALLDAAKEDVVTLSSARGGPTSPALAPLREELRRRVIAGDGPVGEESG